MKAGLEVVGLAGLFITKKRYAINCLDIEGYLSEGGKLKIMVLILKDLIQRVYLRLLEELLASLDGATEDDVIAKIVELKAESQDLDAWKKVCPNVNKLTMYNPRLMEQAKVPENYRLHKLEAVKNEGQSNMITDM